MRALVGLVCFVVVQVVVVASVTAAPRKVLVLPLDGNADAAVRARLNTSVQKLARTIEGEVSVGDTTFEETAAAIGCVPTQPACAESVRATLGVDELVYGSATASNGQTTLVVRRVKAKEPPRASRTTIAAEDPAERAETELAPLFDGSGGTIDDGTFDAVDPGNPEGTGDPIVGTGDPVVVVPEVPEEPPYDNRKRNTGIIFASGGGLSLLIGLVLWSNKSDIQGNIDSAPTRDGDDFASLQDMESRALKYAMFGNVFVIGGLALGGYGAWMLYNDHKERNSVTVTPQVTPTSAGVSVRGSW